MTLMDSVDTAAHRITSGRALSCAATDRERAERVVCAQLLWLSALSVSDRDRCLSEVVDTLVAGDPVDDVLARWHAHAVPAA